VEDVVVPRGGSVLLAETSLSAGVTERLRMRLALPSAFGVPPEVEVLERCIAEAGGYLARMNQSWIFM
jgi:hypothetical protein